jgi:hypothetical protein
MEKGRNRNKNNKSLYKDAELKVQKILQKLSNPTECGVLTNKHVLISELLYLSKITICTLQTVTGDVTQQKHCHI